MSTPPRPVRLARGLLSARPPGATRPLWEEPPQLPRVSGSLTSQASFPQAQEASIKSDLGSAEP